MTGLPAQRSDPDPADKDDQPGRQQLASWLARLAAERGETPPGRFVTEDVLVPLPRIWTERSCSPDGRRAAGLLVLGVIVLLVRMATPVLPACPRSAADETRLHDR